jgi:ABC-type Fe3+/spermidine/putrescine transport system ATPase subunit
MNSCGELPTAVTDDHFPAVELRGVRKQWGPRTILEGVDLAIGRGEVFVLVGPSGSGKSTLLKIVSGIEQPDAGRVFLAGRDVTDQPPFRRAVHTVFQNYALFPHLDVAGNVGFPLRIGKVPRAELEQRVGEALDWVKLESYGRRRVETLSGGERQRVALARALVNQPQCVLLDEPLSALDPHLRTSTLELLQEIQSRLHVTYLYVTHDREEALRIGHRIGVLNHGRLEQVGTPEDVYRRPKTPFVASFLGRINWLPAALCGQKIGCRVGVRPEDVRLSGEGLLDATVVSRQFTGHAHLVRVELADGTQVLVDQRGDALGMEPGQAVRIGWDAAAAHVFPKGEAVAQASPEGGRESLAESSAP